MGQYPFLSDEWLAETGKIRAEYEDRVPEIPVSVRMNQIIQEVPFGDGVIHAYVDTSSGKLVIEPGRLESPDLTVTLAYATARALLVDGDAQAAMNAFLGGRIKIDGDITKLIALQTTGVQSATNPAAIEMVKRIQEITS
jgi:SCP-2 sterol transfer family